MLTMVLALTSTYIFSLMSRLMEEKNKNIGKIYFWILAVIVIIGVAGLRTNIGDTYVYVQSYKGLEGKTLMEVIKEVGDWGYYAFTFYLHKLSNNPQLMIFTNAFITQVLYLKFFYKYRSNIELQMFMYITSGIYFVTMNGIRQSLAAGVVVLATKYLVSGELRKFIPIILFASIFHQSALIMIPIYFISRMKPWSKKVLLMIVLAVVGTMLFYELLPILEKLLKGTNYEHYIKVFREGTEQGANPLRVIVASVPLVLSYIKRKDLEKITWGNIFVNMSVINFIFMLFSMQTWIFARFTIYFSLYTFVLLPYLIKSWNIKKEKRILYTFFIIFYLLFFLKEQRLAERIRFYKF